MSRVVSKMRVSSVEHYGGTSRRVKLTTVYEQNPEGDAEDIRFTKATPSGECWMTIDNEDAAKVFNPADEFYVFFEKIEKPTEG